MICTHPECTGVHDNNRFSELCPRSRAAKRIKDQRYLHDETIIAGRLSKGFMIRLHRMQVALIRRCLTRYGSESGEYARLVGEAEAASAAAEWESRLAKEMERFRARREGHRGTRRKIDTICTGPGRNGVISVKQVIALTRDPDLRTFYMSW
jgi:hypothetical protein